MLFIQRILIIAYLKHILPMQVPMVCPNVHGDNPLALAGGLSTVHVDNHCINICKVSKGAKITNRYHQVPDLTQDIAWESDKIIFKHTNKSHEASLFPAGDHKAAMNRRKSMTNTTHK